MLAGKVNHINEKKLKFKFSRTTYISKKRKVNN